MWKGQEVGCIYLCVYVYVCMSIYMYIHTHMCIGVYVCIGYMPIHIYKAHVMDLMNKMSNYAELSSPLCTGIDATY